MLYYKLVKITMDTPGLAEVVINVIVYHHKVSKSIVTDQSPLFTSKLWSFLCYLPGIKNKLSITFHP